SAPRRSTSLCCIWWRRRRGPTRRSCDGCASACCHRSPETNRSRPGSSMTPAFRRLALGLDPREGSHSVGVARQYCGQLGKQDNCQVAVSLSIATHQGSLPVAYRLYLPKDWAEDPARRGKAGVPEDVAFQTKPEIALQQMRQARADGVPPGVALADPAYGNDSKFRAGITELELPYAVGIMPTTMVWRPGEAPLLPAPRPGRGRRATRLRRDKTHQPVSVKALAVE